LALPRLGLFQGRSRNGQYIKNIAGHRTQSGSTFPDDVELPLELRAIDSKRFHIRPDDILTKVAIHLDDYRSRQAGPRHDEVVAFDSRLDAAEQPGDVAEFLPRNAFQGALLRDGLVCRNCDSDDKRFAQQPIGISFFVPLVGFSGVQRPKI
jgi:hypothetical protein